MAPGAPSNRPVKLASFLDLAHWFKPIAKTIGTQFSRNSARLELGDLMLQIDNVLSNTHSGGMHGWPVGPWNNYLDYFV